MGRPNKLQGDVSASLTVHFCPMDYSRYYDTLVTMMNKEKRSYGEPSRIHEAAATGDIDTLKYLVENNLCSVTDEDDNGWQPLHEAIRAGDITVVRYLIENGADIGAVTINGGSPLWWAKRTLNQYHEIVKLLEEIGAPEITEKDL